MFVFGSVYPAIQSQAFIEQDWLSLFRKLAEEQELKKTAEESVKRRNCNLKIFSFFCLQCSQLVKEIFCTFLKAVNHPANFSGLQ